MNREAAEAWGLGALGAGKGLLEVYLQPGLTSRRAWTAIGLGVAAYELACPRGELLSEGYDRGLERHRTAITVGTLVVTGHLLNWFGKYDPVHAVVEACRV